LFTGRRAGRAQQDEFQRSIPLSKNAMNFFSERKAPVVWLLLTENQLSGNLLTKITLDLPMN
jgi:hypothetical protein